ncbi:unnamed protein product [Miscanthus lutarioriparius]|uniref:Plant heme peroxidase family profile domain-containing protein n=1 Tax=Miscanthus lutarioriparius TaxID=422564 RepID=A0A811QDY4_9POAL|nr:unnamed protein product [Miscanthus lutarioriparius]
MATTTRCSRSSGNVPPGLALPCLLLLLLLAGVSNGQLQTGGPSFDVPTGRLDGKVSNLRDADALPDVHDGIDALRSKFRANGLDEKDLVLLTGCFAISMSINFPML